MNFIKDFFKGIAIGAGAILPGISSGVLCVIFGMYDKLISSVLGIFHDFKKNFMYLLPIGLGGFIGVFLLGKLLKILFASYPMPTNYAFMGLILGSVPLLIKKINSEHTFKLRYLIFTFITFTLGLFTVLLENSISASFLAENINANSIPALLYILAGFFMSIGIVVPGVSSTLILMCFGVYDIYLSAITTMNLQILIPMGIGIVIGGLVFLKLIKYLMEHYYMQTFYAIIGFTLRIDFSIIHSTFV